MKNNYLHILIAVVLFFIGGFFGYKIKRCHEIIKTVRSTDTVYQGYPINSTIIKTKPVNIPYPVLVKGRDSIINIHDTAFLDYPTYTIVDTLRYVDSNSADINVAITDLGNCFGIIERKYIFSGKLTQKIVTNTITNEIAIPPPFISLNAGASISFSNKWKAFDVAPAVGISIRKKHNLIYSYGINTSTHNVSALTTIW